MLLKSLARASATSRALLGELSVLEFAAEASAEDEDTERFAMLLGRLVSTDPGVARADESVGRRAGGLDA